MRKFYKRFLSFVLALSLAAAPALALDGAEAAMYFRQAAHVINERGLIAETAPITDDEIVAACEVLEREPVRLYELLNGFLRRMDAHSGYYAPVTYGQGYEQITGYAGIGVVVRQTATGLWIEAVTAHSPAEAAGIEAGDRLYRIDGKAVDGLTLDKVSELLLGEPGSLVRVTVLRDEKPLTFAIKRAVIHDPEIYAEELPGGIHYIAVGSFTSVYAPIDFEAALAAVDPGDDLILDLRDNGGGVLDYALYMAELLLDNGTYMCSMRMREDQGGRYEIHSEGTGLELDDLVILINGRTASAAELLAGVLHEAGDAVLVGENSYGKGQGQYHMNMASGDVLVLTALEMELPDSGCWEGVGLAPDVPVSPIKMADAAAICTALDTETPIRYGEQSKSVRALTERLVYLGYLAAPTDTFTTPVLSAVRAFQEKVGLDTTIGAYPETLRKLAERMTLAVEGGYYTDSQLTAAMVAALT